ncbi:velvet factor [Gorgonomyces haynaldii]|nr:velvet factor [Gorgonomyces haynaldii]
MSISYVATIKQEPKIGRMCGLPAKKDKRLLGPPLVLELDKYVDKDRVNPNDIEDPHLYYCFLTLSLVSTAPRSSSTLSSKSSDSASSPQHVHGNEFVGTPMTNGQVLKDLNGKSALLFCFPDVGVKSPGIYRLRCDVFKVDTVLMEFPILASVSTGDISVVSPKQYPGSMESTDLTKYLYSQGVPFHIKRETNHH